MKETPRSSPPVDLSLDGGQEVWLALHFVEGYRLAASDQGVGIAPGEVEHVEVVQRQVSASGGRRLPCSGCPHRLANGQRKRTFPRLASPGDDDGGHDAHRGVEAAGNGPGKRKTIHGVNDNHSWRE